MKEICRTYVRHMLGGGSPARFCEASHEGIVGDEGEHVLGLGGLAPEDDAVTGLFHSEPFDVIRLPQGLR